MTGQYQTFKDRGTASREQEEIEGVKLGVGGELGLSRIEGNDLWRRKAAFKPGEEERVELH